MRITTLDFSILGLLLSRAMTAYAIRMIFKTTAMGNYSSSPGTIYPATHKLRKLGLIVRETKDNGLLKITNEGKAQMKAWLTQSITMEEVAKSSHILILKFAFMDYLVSQKEKESFLESFLVLTKTYLKSLKAYHQSDEGIQMPLHGRLSFDYGIANLKTQLSWVKSTLEIIKNKF